MMVEPQKPLAAVEDPRVRFAAERTLLAWIRTGLTLMGFGFVVARFGLSDRIGEVMAAERPYQLSMWMGVALIGLGVLVNVLATLQHTRIIQRINKGEPFVPSGIALQIVLSCTLTAVGILVVAFFLFVRQ